MVGHWQIGKWRESSLKYLRKMKSFCLFISVVRKWGFWHILKSTLILKATHEFNLEIKVDLKSTLISKKQFLHTLKSTLISRQLKFFSQVNNFTPSLQCPLVSSEKGMNIIILNDLLEYYHHDWSSCHAISLAERVLIVCMKISCVWLLTVCFIEIVVRRHQHQYCIALCLDLLCNRKWEEYDCQSLIPRENYLYPVFLNFLQHTVVLNMFFL